MFKKSRAFASFSVDDLGKAEGFTLSFTEGL